MIEQSHIQRWVERGIITREQAGIMLADVAQYKKDKNSGRFITAISTIGAVLLGVGVILFMSSNWEAIPDFVKVFILLSSTLVSCYLGYFLKYQRENLPKVGSALIFLSTLLFGATFFLIAQMYHSPVDSHWLILVWLICVLPLVYLFESVPIASLVAVLFFVWVWFYFGSEQFFSEKGISFFPLIYLLAGLILFGIGTFHHLSEKFVQIARTYRLAGFKVILFTLFLLSFEGFSTIDGHSLSDNVGVNFPVGILASVIFSFLLAVILSILSILINPSRSENPYLEGLVGVGLAVLALVVFLFPTTSIIYAIIFNLVLAGVIIALLYEGYRREDMTLVNMGIFWLEILIIVRYFDFFWDMLPTSAFFMIGGVVLILASVFLERKRRELKKLFSGPNQSMNYNG